MLDLIIIYEIFVAILQQVDFIDSICLPVYDCFGRLCETLLPLKEGCEGNRREWLQLAEKEKDFWDNKD